MLKGIRRKKFLGLLLSLIMVLQMVVPSMETAVAEGGNDLGNIFSLSVFTIDGVTVQDGDVLEVEDNTEIVLRYDWALMDHGGEDGDYATIQVPDAFEPLTDFFGELWIQSEEDSIMVGTYTLTKADNILRLDFNQEIENINIEEGFVQFVLSFNLQAFEEKTTQRIAFSDLEEKEFNITLKPEVLASSISKLGVPDAFVDAQSITWTIDLFNTEESVIEEAILRDEIPVGLILVEGSIAVQELFMKYNGGVTVGDPISVAPQITDEGFEIVFHDITPYTGYRVSYETSFVDFIGTAFTNAATLSYDDWVLPAESTVDNLTRSELVEKTGLVLNQNEIEWTIDFNKPGHDFAQAIIADNMSAGLVLQVDSIRIETLTQQGNNWVGTAVDFASVVADSVISEAGFSLDFGAVNSSEAFRIRFITTVAYDADYQEVNDFDNEVILSEGLDPVAGARAEVTVIRPPIIRKASQSNLTYTDKTITWTIHINEAGHPISTAVVTDTIPDGLTLVVSSLRVYRFDGLVEELVASGDYSVSFTNPDLTVTLGDIGQDRYRIVYDTEISDFTEGKVFQNGASLTGIGVEGTASSTSTSQPTDNTYAKSFRSIDYGQKTIDWRLRINPIKEPITELTIIDTFPNKGLILLDQTLTIRLGSQTLERDVHYALEPLTDGGITGYQKGFQISFLINSSEPFNQVVTIDYKTSFDPDAGIEENTSSNRTVINSARFIGETASGLVFEKTRNASRQLREDAWNSGKKVGQRVHDDGEQIRDGWVSAFAREIEWELYINYLQQDLGSSVVVTDQWNYEGTLIESSLKVQTYTVNPDGTTVPTGELLNPDQYSVAVAPDGFGWQIDFGDFAVTERYVVIFRTQVPQVSLSEYQNTALLEVSGMEYPYTAAVSYQSYDQFLSKEEAFDRNLGNNALIDEIISWRILLNQSLSVIENARLEDVISAGMVLIEDSIRVVRLEGATEVPLNPQDYTVIINGNSVEATTETVLAIIFASDYEFDAMHAVKYETVVVFDTGIVNNEATFSGDNIEEVTVETEELTARQLSFAGGTTSSRRGNLVIMKVDDDTDGPLEARFELFYLLNQEERIIGTEFVTESGTITFENLSFRTYYLREIEAPRSYQRIKQPVEIILSADNVEMVGGQWVMTVTVRNIRSIHLEKSAQVQSESGEVKEYFDAVGDRIHYTLTATNTGDETLTNVGIDDDLQGLEQISFSKIEGEGLEIPNVINGQVELEPQEQLVMRAVYRVNQSDINTGRIDNTATASGQDEEGQTIETDDSESVFAAQEAGISIVKTVARIIDEDGIEKAAFDAVGDRLVYGFIVTNTGNLTLTGVIITDEHVDGPIAYTSINGVEITDHDSLVMEPGDVLIASAEYTITQKDLDDGLVINTASVTALDPNQERVEAEDTAEENATQSPALGISKEARIEDTDGLEKAHFNQIGDSVFYRVTVENIGNTTLSQVRIMDEKEGLFDVRFVKINADGVVTDDDYEGDQPVATLLPGEKFVMTAEYLITSDDLAQGSTNNTARASAQEPGGEPIEEVEDAVSLYSTRSLIIIKVAAQNSQMRLSGSVFRLKDESGEKVWTLTTDENGEALILNLDHGEYSIQELKAPAGFKLDRNIYRLVIDGSQTQFEWLVTNRIQDVIRDTTNQDEDAAGDLDIPDGAVPEIGRPPENGNAVVDGDGNWIYTPNPEFVGEDSFTIIIRYPDGSEEEVLIFIEVLPVEYEVELPDTGGTQTQRYHYAGIAIALLGFCLTASKKKRRVVA